MTVQSIHYDFAIAEVPVVPKGRAMSASVPMFALTRNLRHVRALHALLSGPVSRQVLDVVTGAANSPDLVAQLGRLGLEVPCIKRYFRDQDGLTTHIGIYSLSDRDRIKVLQWLNNHKEQYETVE